MFLTCEIQWKYVLHGDFRFDYLWLFVEDFAEIIAIFLYRDRTENVEKIGRIFLQRNKIKISI